MKRTTILLFCLITSLLLSGCGKKEGGNANAQADSFVYNLQINSAFSENEDTVFYSPERGQILARDKKSGDRGNAIRNPFRSLFDIGPVFYVHANHLYYIKNEETHTQWAPERDQTSIVELDLDTYEEKTVYELDTSRKEESFLGAVQTERGIIGNIYGLFLDRKSIYLVMGSPTGDTLSKVDRRTGRTEILLESSRNINRLAFDGKHIYYINPRFQVVRLDPKTKESFVLPDVITRYMMLAEDDLLFRNARDDGRIYAMDIKDFRLRKITEAAAYAFHYDDKYIYYANEDDHKYLYRVDWEGKNNQKIAELACNGIFVYQNDGELHVSSDQGDYVIDKDTLEASPLE